MIICGPLDSAVYSILPCAFCNLFNNQSNKTTDLWRKTLHDYRAVLFLLIFTTRSMGSIVGIFIALTVYLSRRKDIKILNNRVFKLAVTATGVAILVLVLYTKIVPTLLQPNSSLDERSQIYKTAIHIIKEDKSVITTGLGLSQFEAYFKENAVSALGTEPLDYEIIQPHNHLLLFMFHYGATGIAFLIYLLILCIRNLYKNNNLAETTMLLYFLIHGLIDTPWYKNDMLFILILVVSLTAFRPKAIEQ